MDDIEIKYSVGALLYSPALNSKLADAVISGRLGDRYSLAICLEDTVSDDMVGAAEEQCAQTIRTIRSSKDKAYIPKIFIRVREPSQIRRMYDLTDGSDIITGFIFPKYTIDNAYAYNDALTDINSISSHKLWMMPILESRDMIPLTDRVRILSEIRASIDDMRDYVLNVRVGGNDFSNEFSARRHYDETIYDIHPIASILTDILTTFARDYVVSGPVWEFFSSDNDEWKTGLRRELSLDMLNGFIGKTVIHPKQIPVVNEMLRVTRKDLEDARSILNWDSSGLQVGKSFGGERMNEVRTHYNWARKIVLLSEIYGIV
ncbi:MAG: HpcH/HpaI aldolase/citrate lyase family protein [Oscillospiraceae bacterium]|nr:HpcH/HpaI aldolase/citrate lyase family protein [Oscillospiraceae bacterium]